MVYFRGAQITGIGMIGIALNIKVIATPVFGHERTESGTPDASIILEGLANSFDLENVKQDDIINSNFAGIGGSIWIYTTQEVDTNEERLFNNMIKIKINKAIFVIIACAWIYSQNGNETDFGAQCRDVTNLNACENISDGNRYPSLRI